MSREQVERQYLPTRFLLDAAMDYASARCLLLNGLPGGFPLAARASDKLLKGYLLHLDQDFPTRRFSHKLSKLLFEADNSSPSLNISCFSSFAQKFEKYYYASYADDPHWPQSMDTRELAELDEFTMVLNENLAYTGAEKFRVGLYALATFSLNPLNKPTPIERWLKYQNEALARRWSEIEAEYYKV